MADVIGGGAPAQSQTFGNNGGAGGGYQGTQTIPRARAGELDLGSGYGSQQQIALQNPGLVERGTDPNDPFSPIAGTGEDAQSQALAIDDSANAEVVEGADEQQQAANALTEADVRRMLDEYRAWADADDLAHPLMGKFVVATVDGQRYRIPVEEAVKGYQRNSDYSNKMRQWSQLKAEVEGQQRGMQRFMADLDDGQTFLDAMMRIGKMEGFHRAAMIYGTQLAAERKMTPQERQVYQELRRMRARSRQLELDNARLTQVAEQRAQQQAQLQPPQGPSYDIYMQQLQHLIPRVAERIGFEATPLAMREFEAHFANLLPSLQGGDVTSDFVETCMLAAQESVAKHMQAGYVQPEPPSQAPAYSRAPNGRFSRGQQQQQAVPPASRVAGVPGTAPQRATRAKIGDFDRAVRGRPV